jgi:hypothetical protein
MERSPDCPRRGWLAAIGARHCYDGILLPQLSRPQPSENRLQPAQAGRLKKNLNRRRPGFSVEPFCQAGPTRRLRRRSQQPCNSLRQYKSQESNPCNRSSHSQSETRKLQFICNCHRHGLQRRKFCVFIRQAEIETPVWIRGNMAVHKKASCG